MRGMTPPCSRWGGRIAFTTDSYVVRPAFFPGGDIGTLAVNGTVNDRAMSGARPMWLSAAFILEEGFPLESFRTVLDSMGAAARAVGAEIVTGDTKVVDHRRGDGIFVNTAGIGLLGIRFRLLPPVFVSETPSSCRAISAGMASPSCLREKDSHSRWRL
jgi:hydrogenase expression/formation protein HypE